MLSLFYWPKYEVEWLKVRDDREGGKNADFKKNHQILLLVVSVMLDVCFHSPKLFHTFEPIFFTEIVQQFLDRSPGSSYKSVTKLPK